MEQRDIIPVRLSDTELDVAVSIGMLRHHQNQTGKTTNYMEDMGLTKQQDCDILGARGELAFCKWANVYPEALTCHNRRLTADGRLFGYLVDVKTRRRADAPMEVRIEKQASRTQVYVLVLQDPKDEHLMHLHGWVFADELYQPERITNGRFVVQQDDRAFRRIMELKERAYG